MKQHHPSTEDCIPHAVWIAALAFWCLSFANPAQSQIASDGTLSTNVTTPDNLNFTINDGNRVGNNLFHSFREFSVPTGGSAAFNNASDIQNIFSRVTGGSISNIDGLIRANGAANLFLLNPNGIIFGPNAQLNIGGSFLASTASSLQFADGTFFSVTPSQSTPLLTISVPIGLQYGGGKAGEIRVQGNGQDLGLSGAIDRFDNSLNPLEVNPGKTLALVGGNVIVDGGILQTSGGRVEIGGLTGEGTVGINADGSLSFPDGVARADISITNKAGINVLAGGGGSIAINARNLEISGDSLLTAGIAAGKGSADTIAGDILINAIAAITITSSQVENIVNPDASGNSGNINITTGSLFVTGGAQLASSISGQGKAGNVMIVARDTVSLDGIGSEGSPSAALSTVEENAVGDAGSIDITTGSLFITGGAQLASSIFGQGKAGRVTIVARNTVSLDGVSSNGSASSVLSTVEETAVGDGGEIDITAESLFVTGGAQLVALTRGQGNAGSMTILARDTVSFDGVDSSGFVSGAASAVLKSAVGNGGIINITTGSLLVTGGAQLVSSTFGQGKAGSVIIAARDTVSFDGVSSNGFASAVASTVEQTAVGDGGGIDITTESLSVTGGARLIASSRGQGNAGNVMIVARDIVSFDGNDTGATSAVEPTGKGNGGNINITTGSLSVTGGAQLASSIFGQGKAGDITLVARDTVSFDGIGSEGFASAAFSTVEENAVGDGGSINITAGSLFLTREAALVAGTRGQGKAGRVTIVARDQVSFDRGYAFSTVTETGKGDGNSISITTGSLSVTGGGQLLTLTRGQGNAGSITIAAQDSVLFDGVDSNGFFSAAASAVEENAVGDGGSINVTTGSLSISNGAELSASSMGSGKAGNINVQADSLRLDNQAQIRADTVLGQGNIFLRSPSITLTRGSRITTDATGGTSGGNIEVKASSLILRQNSLIATNAEGTKVQGGNITLDTDIIAALEDSDISANSESFFGGRVIINAQSVFGTQFRDATTLESDITATGGTPEQRGTVQINTPEVDPSSGLIELPQNFVDATALVDRRCQGGNNASRFVVTGRGGLPPSPNEPLSGEVFWEDWRSPSNVRLSSVERPSTTDNRQRRTNQIVEATGWIIGSKGEIILTAEARTATPHRSGLAPVNCDVR